MKASNVFLRNRGQVLNSSEIYRRSFSKIWATILVLRGKKTTDFQFSPKMCWAKGPSVNLRTIATVWEAILEKYRHFKEKVWPGNWWKLYKTPNAHTKQTLNHYSNLTGKQWNRLGETHAIVKMAWNLIKKVVAQFRFNLVTTWTSVNIPNATQSGWQI